ncbi:ce2C [Symbiodinium sp. CCMP2592]|nr:ce2C [Symbiodinium sp. CCMP2592]
MGSSASRVVGPPETPPAGHCFTAADSQRLRFCGRHLQNEGGGSVSFDWPCTSFRFRTRSKRVWLRMDGARNYFNVLVNGGLLLVLKTSAALRDYRLDIPVPTAPARPAGAGGSVVEVQKRTEALIGSLFQKPTGLVVLHGIIADSELEELPPDEVTRQLEFLGDSETSGFGNQGPSQPGEPGLISVLSMHPAHQDANQAWPALVAGALKADFHNIAWSGAGVVWNAPGCSAEVPFKDLYLRVLGTKEEPTIKKGDGWSPEATVVYLGGNDWWSLSSRGDDALIDGLREFLTRLRAYRGPEVPICILLPSPTSVCACIGSLPDQATFAADMSRCWRAAAQLAGDEKVFLDLIEPDPPCSLSNPSDWGQMGHWSVEGNKKWAAAVVPVLKARLDSITT